MTEELGKPGIVLVGPDRCSEAAWTSRRKQCFVVPQVRLLPSRGEFIILLTSNQTWIMRYKSSSDHIISLYQHLDWMNFKNCLKSQWMKHLIVHKTCFILSGTWVLSEKATLWKSHSHNFESRISCSSCPRRHCGSHRANRFSHHWIGKLILGIVDF